MKNMKIQIFEVNELVNKFQSQVNLNNTELEKNEVIQALKRSTRLDETPISNTESAQAMYAHFRNRKVCIRCTFS